MEVKHVLPKRRNPLRRTSQGPDEGVGSRRCDLVGSACAGRAFSSTGVALSVLMTDRTIGIEAADR